MRNPVWPFSCVTPAGRSNELDVQNKWEENTHTEKKGLVQKLPTQIILRATRKQGGEHKVLRAQVRILVQVERVCNTLCRA